MNVRRFLICIMVLGHVLYGNLVYGTECAKKVQPIREGQVASCSGFLFSDEAESQAYKDKRIAELREEENKILNERLQGYKSVAESLAKDKARSDNNQMLYNSAWFAIGAVVTGFIAANVSK